MSSDMRTPEDPTKPTNLNKEKQEEYQQWQEQIRQNLSPLRKKRIEYLEQEIENLQKQLQQQQEQQEIVVKLSSFRIKEKEFWQEQQRLYQQQKTRKSNFFSIDYNINYYIDYDFKPSKELRELYDATFELDKLERKQKSVLLNLKKKTELYEKALAAGEYGSDEKILLDRTQKECNTLDQQISAIKKKYNNYIN